MRYPPPQQPAEASQHADAVVVGEAEGIWERASSGIHSQSLEGVPIPDPSAQFPLSLSIPIAAAS